MDRQSNNVSLFGLVEQVNVRAGSPRPPGGILPVEVHAYFQLSEDKRDEQFELRLVLASDSGLETIGEPFKNRGGAARFRVRSIGLPYPPVPGNYTVRIEFRTVDALQERAWERQTAAWPLTFREMEARPAVTH